MCRSGFDRDGTFVYALPVITEAIRKIFFKGCKYIYIYLVVSGENELTCQFQND
jgi:hypothetical protein